MAEFGVADPPTRKTRIAPFRVESGVDIAYGEKSWRPVQSVIDLVQNHLDANTTNYEKALLAAAFPEAPSPEELAVWEEASVYEILDEFKNAQDDDDYYDAYYSLEQITEFKSNLPEPSELGLRLKEVNYELPRIQLKLNRGEETKFVEYADVATETSDWEITGFRIHDQGAGFDYRFLGIMGGTTKKESTGKRGGLGEGLKMSITHLVRSGADVRLLSRNGEELWIAHPKNEDGSVVFEGRKRTEGDQGDSGSITDVDFTSPVFDPALRREIVQALDPRRGEGLGKYILDYRDPKFIPLVNKTVGLSPEGVPGGRVYVKGLLVQETPTLLWSYNLGDKWAINGRDRKTVDLTKLKNAVDAGLEALDDPELITQLVTAVKWRGQELEVERLSANLDLDGYRAEIWREAVESVFDFRPGNILFVREGDDRSKIRYAQDLGYELILLRSKNEDISRFLKKLYPDQMITLDDFLRRNTKDVHKRLEEGHEITGSDSEVLRNLTGHFADVLKSSGFYSTRRQGIVKEKEAFPESFERFNSYFKTIDPDMPFSIERLGIVKFVYDPHALVYEGDSNFTYLADTKVMLVRKDIKDMDFGDVADLYIQLVKAYVGTNSFDTATQDVLTKLAAESIAELRPELLEALNISLPETAKFGSKENYDQENQRADEVSLESLKKLRTLNALGITKAEIDKVLAEVRASLPADINEGNPKASFAPVLNALRGINSTFYFEGKIYKVNENSLALEEVATTRFSNREYGWEATGRRILLNPTSKGKFNLQTGGKYFIPFNLKAGEVANYRFSTTEGDRVITFKRIGDEMVVTRSINGSIDTLKIGQEGAILDFSDSSTFSVYNNVLYVYSGVGKNINLSSEIISPEPAEPKSEVNKGRGFLSTSITIDYGGKVWADPRRILLDAIQNHIDASRELPNLTYTVVNRQGKISTVSDAELRGMDREWRIIGFEVSDKGEGFTTPYLTNLGSTTKTDEQIGKFGEGLKLLAGSALKKGIKMRLSSRDWVAEPVAHITTVRDYEKGIDKDYDLLGFNMAWQDEPRKGSSTSFSALDLEPGQTQLDIEQKDMLNFLFEPRDELGAIWSSWVNELDPRLVNEFGQQGIEGLVLPRDKKVQPKRVTVLTDMPGAVFENGLLIPRDPEDVKEFIFGYNFMDTVINTRERNSYSTSLMDGYLKDYFSKLTDPAIMERILEAARDNPYIDFYEYKFIMGDQSMPVETHLLWRKAFYKVFGRDAILSMAPELVKITNDEAKGFKNDARKTVLERAVANEVHLERGNIISLPVQLTELLSVWVYDSEDFTEEIGSKDLRLQPEDHEKLYRYVQSVNTVLLGAMQALDFDEDSRGFIDKSSADFSEQKMGRLAAISPDELHVKGVAYPVAGSVKGMGDMVDISVKQDYLNDPKNILAIYLHEALHYLSGETDYRLKFQRIMMAIAALRIIPTKSQRAALYRAAA